MSLPDRPSPPRAALDRSAVERVLARAAQLQAGDTGEMPSERLTEAQLVELGREVGLSPEHLRQALAEERTRVPAVAEGLTPESGMLDTVLGDAAVSTTRTVRVPAGTALAQIDRWMRDHECLGVMRRFDDRILWEPKRGIVAQLQPVLNIGGRSYALTRADLVAATVVPVSDGQTLVRLDASFAASRRSAAGTGGVVATMGAGASGAAVAIGVMLPVAIVPALVLGAGAYFGARRRHRATMARAALALEQILDGLERGELARESPFKIFSL